MMKFEGWDGFRLFWRIISEMLHDRTQVTALRDKKLRWRKEDSAAVAEILKGNLKYMGASLTQGHAHFFSGCDFIVGIGKPKMCTKFEVANFSHCANILVEPQNFGELP